jgi:imidazole glycerol-phosphate synthase subunit HisH
MRVIVVDYDSGNVRSVQRALQAVAGENSSVEITRDPAKIREAHAVVFPGQGAAGQCMTNLRKTRLGEAIQERLASGRAFMGVCVGLQLMFSYLEENDTTGLGILPGDVRRFPDRTGYKVPQIGWNSVRQTKDSRLWAGVPDESYFYFVHSYYTAPASAAENFVAGTTDYGFEFASAFANANWMGTQFHPEKSGKLGLRLYSNFLDFARSI